MSKLKTEIEEQSQAITATTELKQNKEIEKTDADTPWKEIMDVYFQDFIALCWPEKYSEIDWSKGYKMLDKELKKISRNAPVGNRVADKVIEVSHHDGGSSSILLHIEVQGDSKRPQDELGERMLVYRYRLRDTYQKPIASLAILIDNNPRNRICSHKEEFWGSSLEVKFKMIKLIDYRVWIQELEQSSNRFAPVILAQLAVLDNLDPQNKLASKIRLTRNLYLKGWTKDDILMLYRFIDWIMVLPLELEVQYQKTIEQLEEEEAKVSYITTAERLGLKRGMEQGERGFLLHILKRKFKQVPEPYLQQVTQANSDLLIRWLERSFESKALEEVFAT